MDATSPRWRQVTPSQFDWERQALDALRDLLPDSEPYNGWTNFTMIEGGAIAEIDALVTTPKGVFLVEVKSWSGEVRGDQTRWVQFRRDGSRETHSNEVATTQRKAQRLKSLVSRNWQRGGVGDRAPFVEPLVWFSNPDLRVELPAELLRFVAVAEGNTRARGARTLAEAILDVGADDAGRGHQRPGRGTIERLARIIDGLGFRERAGYSIGSYDLKLPAFAERGGTQDFRAEHKQEHHPARIRVFSAPAGASPEELQTLRRAAQREYHATRNSPVDGVCRATDFVMSDLGPAVVFDHDPRWVRLDRFDGLDDGSLDLDARLGILESIGSTVREMHRLGISHRGLTPASVWLRPRPGATPGTTVWEPLISDFAVAARGEAEVGLSRPAFTMHAAPATVHGSDAAAVYGDTVNDTYLAPEWLTDADADGVRLDVYSVGSLAFRLLAGRDPAPDRAALLEALRNGGLSVAMFVDGLIPEIEAFVRECTTPLVDQRIADMARVVDAIGVIRRRCAGELGDEADPLSATIGQVLIGRFEVKERLGSGATAVALWCRDRVADRDVVLKVALAKTPPERIAAEATALRGLRQENVVECFEELEIGGRPTLVLSFAGSRSLAAHLRDEGTVGGEFLKRWGSDVLEAIRYLERRGIWHRDVKPDNLGIMPVGKRREPHLVLFDFSLSGTPARELTAGTPPYLDPFLADPGRGAYDFHAELYAAAVTIHVMATGEPPQWGDGRTDPQFLPAGEEATIRIEAIEPDLRERIVPFLARALRRDVKDRFDTADDMARAWNDAFAGWEEPEGADDTPDGLEANANAGDGGIRLPDQLAFDDPIVSLGVSRKVRSALGRLGAELVCDVARLDAMAINQVRNVSRDTRRRVNRLRAALIERFAEELAAAQSPLVAEPTERETANAGRLEPADRPPVVWARPDLDELLPRLSLPRPRRGPVGAVPETVRLLLGLTPLDGDNDWATIRAIAARLGLTAPAVTVTHTKARKHWASSPELMGVGGDLLAILADLGGVAGVSELAAPLVEARGSGQDEAAARRVAAAIIRAVVEAHSSFEDWLVVRRFGRRSVVAVNGAAIAADEAADTPAVLPFALDPELRERLARFDAEALLGSATALGRRADALVSANALVPSSDAVPALRALWGRDELALSDARLVRLAAAASGDAGANLASDLFLLRIEPIAALRWVRPALVNADRLTPEGLGARVRDRFPAVGLPERPELDALLAEAGLAFVWSETVAAFVPSESGPQGIGPLTRLPSRQPTRLGGSAAGARPEPTDPEVVAAHEIDERLVRSIAEGGFVVLRVPTDRLADARRGLARFQSGPTPMVHVDLEALFLRHLRATAERRRIAWSNLEAADERDGPHWTRLSVVAEEAVDAVVAEVTASDRVVAWFPGSLVRHGSAGGTGPIDRLREAVSAAGSPLRTLWLVVLAGSVDARPVVDGAPVPVLAQSEWIDVGDGWLRNVHRAGELSA